MWSDWLVARRVAIACIVLALFYFAWQVIDVFLLVFAALLVSLMLHALAEPLSRMTRIPERYAVIVVGLLGIGAIAVAFWLFGSTIQAQVSDLVQQLPSAWQRVVTRFNLQSISDDILRHAEAAAPSGDTMLSALQGFTSNVANILLGLFLVIVGGIYFAVDPQLYRRLFLSLWPAEQRGEMAERLEAVSADMRHFLKAQLIAMVVVGVLTYAGLAMLGIPSALALGLFTGLAEFIPLVGPVVSAVPAVLMGLTVSTETALWTLLWFVLVQQVESNIITPLLQQRMVSLPPAVTLFAVVAFGTLLGPMGVLLATPLTVLVFAATRPLDD